MQNKPQYGGGGDCGKRAHIKGPKGEVTVTIVVSWPHDRTCLLCSPPFAKH